MDVLVIISGIVVDIGVGVDSIMGGSGFDIIIIGDGVDVIDLSLIGGVDIIIDFVLDDCSGVFFDVFDV